MDETFDPAQTSLTSTLILALSQSQEQNRLLLEKARAITRLQLENVKLKEELQSLKQSNEQNEAYNAIKAQMDEMFHRDAEKQAELDLVRKHLRKAQQKERYWRERHPFLSSPALSSDGPTSEDGRLLCASNHNATSPLVAAVNNSNHETISSPARKRLRSSSPHHRGVLQAISGNATSSPAKEVITNKPGRTAPVKKSEARGSGAIDAVAEDGADYSIKDRKEDKPATTTSASTMPQQRLGALLDQPSPGPAVLSKSSVATPSSIKTGRTGHALSAHTAPRENDKPQSLSSEARPKTPKVLTGAVKESTSPLTSEPLRQRHLTRLKIGDFKVNPKANAGLDHAYNEVVRNREQRKCLPGCTRPECCGAKFKAIAQTLPLSQTELSDDDLLRQYFGPDSEEKIKTLTSLARLNLVAEARIKNVADSYGKMHRAAFERAPSSPGYWNADMPGTQEREENKEESRRRERLEVERRYQEAMKDDGLWKFADE